MENDSEPFYFATEMSNTDKAVSVLIRVLFGLSLVACVTSAAEQAADWRDGRRKARIWSERSIKSGSDHTPTAPLSERRVGSGIITRLLFFINCAFALLSVAELAGTNLAPPNNDLSIRPTWGAIGNQATCTAQGFVAYVTMMVIYPLDASLSLCYLLMIHYGWREGQLRSLEKWFHLFSWVWTLGLAFLGIYYDGYNPLSDICFLTSRTVCIDLREDGYCYETEIVRGASPLADSASSRLYFFVTRLGSMAMIVLHLVFTLYVMIRVCLYAFNRSQQRPNEALRRVVIKGALYVSVTLAAQIPQAASLALFFIAPEAWISVFVNRVRSCLLPFIGINNMLVFFWGRTEMKTSLGDWMRDLLDGVVVIFCSKRQSSDRVSEDELDDGIQLGIQLFATTTEE